MIFFSKMTALFVTVFLASQAFANNSEKNIDDGLQFSIKNLKPVQSDFCGTAAPIDIDVKEHKTFNCKSQNVTVLSKSANDVELACKGADRAYTFFKQNGFDKKTPLQIVVTKQIPKHLKQLGYQWESQFIAFVDQTNFKVFIPPFDYIKANKDEFKSPLNKTIDQEIYTSYITHEASHVIAQFNYAHPCYQMPSERQEFIAYVAQLSTLRNNHREHFLEFFYKKNWEVFKSIDEINPDYHLVNPTGFSAKSYLYFQTNAGKITLQDFMQAQASPMQISME